MTKRRMNKKTKSFIVDLIYSMQDALLVLGYRSGYDIQVEFDELNNDLLNRKSERINRGE